MVSYLYLVFRKFADWPLVYMAVIQIVLFKEYNLFALSILVLLIFITAFNFSILGNYQNLADFSNVKKYLLNFKDCTFRVFSISDYLPEKVLNRDWYFSENPNIKAFWDFHRRKLNSNSFVAAVKANSNSKNRPTGLKAYPFSYSLIIFSRELPEDLNPILRLKIFHEYFHSSFPAMLSRRRITLGIGPSILMLIYISLHLNWNLTSASVIISIAAIYLTGYLYYWNNEKSEEKLYAELYADYMALTSLSEPDLQFILNFKLKNEIVTRDPGLSELQNITRKYHFMSMLDDYANGKEPSIYNIQTTKDYPFYIYIILMLTIFLTLSMKPMNKDHLYIDLGLFGLVFFTNIFLMRRVIINEKGISEFLQIDFKNKL